MKVERRVEETESGVGFVCVPQESHALLLSVTQQSMQNEGPQCEMQDLPMALSVGEGFSLGPEEREPKLAQIKAIWTQTTF